MLIKYEKRKLKIRISDWELINLTMVLFSVGLIVYFCGGIK